jgi:LDH2 family malate/lactate/ureidoglycolate dehydrogenase
VLPAELERIASELLEAAGVSAADAAWTASLLVASDLAGHPSHGVLRLPAYLDALERGATDPRGVPRVVRDQGATAIIDGELALGQVVARLAADEAIARAREHGIACVAVRRAGHAGRLAHFSERIAAAGQIGMVFANDAGGSQAVAPPGATAARLSTNPLAIAAPRGDGPPFSLDMSTSVVSAGKVRVHRERGETVPEGWELGGVLQSLGGYKGFGLGLAVEILAGVLSGAGHSTEQAAALGRDDEQGMTFIAIEISRFLPPGELERGVDEVAGYVRSAPLVPGAAPIVLPGELGAAAAREQRTAGVLLTERTREQLRAACARAGVGSSL